jgi:hypothetical protein
MGSAKARTVHFEAVMSAITQIRCVVVPPAVGERLDAGTRTSVRARVLGIEFDSTLTPVRAGGHRLSIPSTVWKPRGLNIGDPIPVEIWRVDPAPVVMPVELEPLAAATPALRDAYFAISPSDRRQVEKYLAGIVSPDARAHWIKRLAGKLLSPRTRRPKASRTVRA